MDAANEYEVRRVTLHFLPVPGAGTPDPLSLDAIAEELSPPTFPFWIVPVVSDEYKVFNMTTVAYVDMPRQKPYRPSQGFKLTRLVEG